MPIYGEGIESNGSFENLTLVHEDIYVYIDKIEELTQTLSGASTFVLSNDATDSIVDPGVVTINVTSGSYTALTITHGSVTLTLSQPLSTGDTLLLNLRERLYKLNDTILFFDDVLILNNDANNTINLSFTGTGTLDVSYVRNLPVVNSNDLFFCTSLDVNQNTEVIKKNNIKAQTKLHKTAKKDNQWSINGLCNDTELDKFESGTGFFRLRLVGEDGVGLDKLANCVISSFQRSSSETSDYTYSLSGSFQDTFN